jgi:hypothetical protein
VELRVRGREAPRRAHDRPGLNALGVRQKPLGEYEEKHLKAENTTLARYDRVTPTTTFIAG